MRAEDAVACATLVGLSALHHIAIGGHVAWRHLRARARWRRHRAEHPRALNRIVRRCAAGARRITRVRRVQSHRVQHQRLPAGLLEDRLRGWLPQCGRRCRQVVRCQLYGRWIYGRDGLLRRWRRTAPTPSRWDVRLPPERLLRLRQRRLLQPPPDGRTQPLLPAAVRECAPTLNR